MTGEILTATAPAPEAATAEASYFKVNGPLWDSRVIPMEPESANEAIRRRRLMQQAGRRSKRNAEDQALILALQNQVDAEHNRAEATAAELARFLQDAEDAGGSSI